MGSKTYWRLYLSAPYFLARKLINDGFPRLDSNGDKRSSKLSKVGKRQSKQLAVYFPTGDSVPLYSISFKTNQDDVPVCLLNLE